MPTWDLLGFGAVAVDDLLLVDSYPPPDSKMPVPRCSTRGRRAGRHGPGPAASGRMDGLRRRPGQRRAVTLHHRRVPRAGVDCTSVRYRPDARPYRPPSSWTTPGATGRFLFTAAGVTSLTAAEATEELVAGCRLLFVDSTVAALGLHVLRLARARGIPVVADLERFSAEVPELTRQVDHLIVSTGFAGQSTGDTDPPRWCGRCGARRTPPAWSRPATAAAGT